MSSLKAASVPLDTSNWPPCLTRDKWKYGDYTGTSFPSVVGKVFPTLRIWFSHYDRSKRNMLHKSVVYMWRYWHVWPCGTWTEPRTKKIIVEMIGRLHSGVMAQTWCVDNTAKRFDVTNGVTHEGVQLSFLWNLLFRICPKVYKVLDQSLAWILTYLVCLSSEIKRQHGGLLFVNHFMQVTAPLLLTTMILF